MVCGCEYAPTEHSHDLNSINGICRVHMGSDLDDFQCHDNITAIDCVSLDWIKYTEDGYGWYSDSGESVDCPNCTPYSSDDNVSQFFFPDSTCSELCLTEISNSKVCTIIDLNN